MIPKLVFYGLSAVLLLAATMVITSRNSVRSVLYLVLAFVASSGLWILLQAEFLGIILIVVYVGAVMVLFLFVVMMLDVQISSAKEGFTQHLPLAVFVAVAFVGQLIWIFLAPQFSSAQMGELTLQPEEYSNIKELGMVLYTDYVFAFELAAVLLLTAMIAAVALTLRGRRKRRGQDISQQVRVTKEERLKIIKDL